jgi:hypothetical protein
MLNACLTATFFSEQLPGVRHFNQRVSMIRRLGEARQGTALGRETQV